jgi:glycosyltransferase involved in cell wall biosynthesis
MNTSGVPGQLVLAERQLGFTTRLITLFRDRRSYFEDICLDLPFIDFAGTKWIKKHVSAPEKLSVTNVARIPEKIPVVWQPHSIAEILLVRLRDLMWRPKIQRAIRRFELDQFDVYQLDGGLDFYRHAGFIKRQKALGKKIICCYTGSDLRTRGVIPAIDAMSDVNVSVEFDHLRLHPRIHHVFFPFDAARFQPKSNEVSEKIRVGHAPTSWAAKGSEVIVPILKSLEADYPVEMILIQNLPYAQAIELKSTCDIFVDQIGDLGYGINSLEALAMEIPTCSCLAPGFAETSPDHPFIAIDGANLRNELIRLIQSPELRRQMGQQGRVWVEKYHNAVNTIREIHRLAEIVE